GSEYIGYVDIPDGYSSVTLKVTPKADTTSSSDTNVSEWDKAVKIELLEVSDSTPSSFTRGSDGFVSDHVPVTYVVDDLHKTAQVTIFDNSSDIGGFVDRNVDVVSTGEGKQTVGNGTVNVDVQGGEVTLSGALKFDQYSPIYYGNDNLQPIIS